MSASPSQARSRRSIWSLPLVALLLILGCTYSGGKPGGDTSRDAGGAATSTRPAGSTGSLADHAAGMAEEDARRTKTAAAKPGQTRPPLMRRESRSPVDQPRIR